MGIADIIMLIRVDADAIQVPGNMWCGATSDSTGHVALVAFWWSVDFQRNQNGWRPVQSDHGWQISDY